VINNILNYLILKHNLIIKIITNSIIILIKVIIILIRMIKILIIMIIKIIIIIIIKVTTKMKIIMIKVIIQIIRIIIISQNNRYVLKFHNKDSHQHLVNHYICKIQYHINRKH